jgi:hypothetical protein
MGGMGSRGKDKKMLKGAITSTLAPLSSLKGHAIVRILLLWRINTLLGKYFETNETTAVTMDWRGKHVSITVTVGDDVFYSVRAKGL